MTRTAYDIAADYCRLGVKEKAGISDHPAILHMLKLDQSWPQHDEVPWCAAFVNLAATPSTIFILGGNQNDEVNICEYPASLLLGVRRLRPV